MKKKLDLPWLENKGEQPEFDGLVDYKTRDGALGSDYAPAALEWSISAPSCGEPANPFDILLWRPVQYIDDEDVVNHPTHYTSGGIETITYIKAKLTPEEYRGFLKGTILKYASRAGKKDDELQDTEKQQWYTNKLVEVLKDDKR